MEIFVQQRETGCFLGEGNQWVRTKQDAMRFETSALALEYCLRNKIEAVEIILGFDDPGLDCRLKVN